MTDMPNWRSWADQAHKDSLRIAKPTKNRRFKCKTCDNKTTKGQAKKNGNVCWSCGSSLSQHVPN